MKIISGAEKSSLGWKVLAVSMMCLGVASCGTTKTLPEKKAARSKEYFSEKEYGVKASPRVAYGKKIPKGGGRYMVGSPYVVKGKTYVPKEDFSYNKVGTASWYGSAFHGRLTANGEVYDLDHLSAAHPTFPLPSYARVTNVENGSSVIVRVNDRGPFHPGRIIDVSSKTADLIDLKHSGTGKVRVQYVGRARMDGHDMPYLMASYIPKGNRFPSVQPEGQIASGVMVASNQSMGDQLRSLDPASSMTSLAGRTPSEPYAAQATLPMPKAQPESIAVFDQTVMLPQIGPVPASRPGMVYAVAYAPAPAAKAKPSLNAAMADNTEHSLGRLVIPAKVQTQY